MSEQAKKLDTIRRKQQALTKAREKYDKTLQRQANLSFVGMAGYGSGTKILQGAASVIQPGIAFEEQMSAVGALSRVSNTSEAFAKLREPSKGIRAHLHPFQHQKQPEACNFWLWLVLKSMKYSLQCLHARSRQSR